MPTTMFIYRLHKLYLCCIGTFECFVSNKAEINRLIEAYQITKTVWN